MLLDTCAIIDFLRNDSNIINKLNYTSGFIISVISVFEIWQGIRDSEKNMINSFFSKCKIINLDLQSSEEAGNISKSLKNYGNEIEPLDCLIAGICITNNKVILTRNKKDFIKVPGLKVETY